MVRLAAQSDLPLLNTLYRAIDQTYSMQLSAWDIRVLVEKWMPDLDKYPDRFYQALVRKYSNQVYKYINYEENGQKNSTCTKVGLSFADFLLLIWPTHRFAGLQHYKDILFLNKFPVYSSTPNSRSISDYNSTCSLSSATFSLVAEIIANML